ncbi:hypothetical protein [Listeria booriae]|uniref:hypothetical protein n=1 Tax=Listeria booriae TaxID=1552123 RepID=UPI001626DB96|nr:hypothetical protein [Listeria booriae]MBC2188702.1 hypothetical protein [Listeria booriae]
MTLFDSTKAKGAFIVVHVDDAGNEKIRALYRTRYQALCWTKRLKDNPFRVYRVTETGVEEVQEGD